MQGLPQKDREAEPGPKVDFAVLAARRQEEMTGQDRAFLASRPEMVPVGR